MRTLSLLLVLVATSGCLKATVDTGRVREIALDDDFAAAPAFFVDIVRDRRDERERVGVVKNGYNQVLRDVHATDDVTVWLGESVRESLRASGATVVERDAPGVVWMRLSIVEIFTEGSPGAFLFECAGKVVFDVELELPDGRAFKRRFGGLSRESYFQAPRDVHELHVERAADKAIKRLLLALRALVHGGT